MLVSSHFMITITVISYFYRSGAEDTRPLSWRVDVDSIAVAGCQEVTLATCTVINPPQLVTVTPFNDPSYAEVFQCEADANPPATDFTWHSKHVTIPNDAIEIKGNKLYFLKLSSDLNGVYFCNASNMYGAGVGSLFWHQGKKTEDYHSEL
ncbi:uncharacterized protein si:ch211-214p13.3 isoform X8 [Danio rerio]|uniref:Uncharacterized protein si:ch211-214p13.3 isoform X8 n=1 Tax=Danio rerio TaxID=7955 RepID=A0AC58GFT6_DANRE